MLNHDGHIVFYQHSKLAELSNWSSYFSKWITFTNIQVTENPVAMEFEGIFFKQCLKVSTRLQRFFRVWVWNNFRISTVLNIYLAACSLALNVSIGTLLGVFLSFHLSPSQSLASLCHFLSTCDFSRQVQPNMLFVCSASTGKSGKHAAKSLLKDWAVA